MADVFLSYASEDRDRVKPLADALEAAGFTVWWDRRIDLGTSFDREIEQQLSAASCVMVVWSKDSVESAWVREEADDGLRRKILIPVQIDECELPLGFRRTQTAQLIGWPGGKQDVGFLVERVKSLTGKAVEPSPITRRSRWRVATAWAGGLLLIAAILGYSFRDALLLTLLLNAPALVLGAPIEQELNFTTAKDGTRIAYATSGEGNPVVQVLGMSTHLESGQSSPIYDTEGLLAMSSRNHLFIRYDGRGTGLSDRDVQDFSLPARVSDLEAVVDELELDQFGILGVSVGGQAAIAYTAKHPERVTRLVLAGAVVSYDFGGEQGLLIGEEMLDLIEIGWERPYVANMFAENLLGPDGGPVERGFLAEILRRAHDGRTLAAFYRAAFKSDLKDEAELLSVPTLVIHARDDNVVPLEQSRKLAALIPGSKLELVDGGHMASSASTAASRRRALEFLDSGQ